ncbi:MAG TPA: DsbA family protein [Burkholderiaceae bacterium]|nr:DsbA family protein [Burkholderiaceae bacterium]
MGARLHYVHDPLCGWCYAAAPLVKAAREVLDVVAHAGGMLTGARRRAVTDDWRSYVMPHDRRIEALSGQPFGVAYFDGLLRDRTAVLDSAPPTTAVLAADRLGGRGLDLLARLQTAHYVEGRRIADREVLVELAQDIGLAGGPFAAAFDELAGEPTEAHFSQSSQLLHAIGGNGFPTFALERGRQLELVASAPFLGKPQAWKDELARLTAGDVRPE